MILAVGAGMSKEAVKTQRHGTVAGQNGVGRRHICPNLLCAVPVPSEHGRRCAPKRPCFIAVIQSRKTGGGIGRALVCEYAAPIGLGAVLPNRRPRLEPRHIDKHRKIRSTRCSA